MSQAFLACSSETWQARHDLSRDSQFNRLISYMAPVLVGYEIPARLVLYDGSQYARHFREV